tara:strand:- start:698 stop:976 length:279 start_codon:yes stop_codon:yes gene_type:complete
MTSNKQPLKIDKGVPLPKTGGRQAKTQHFYDALDVLEIEDSVEFPVDGVRGPHNALTSKAGESFAQLAKRRGFKMTRRLSDDRQTIRYWRIK